MRECASVRGVDDDDVTSHDFGASHPKEPKHENAEDDADEDENGDVEENPTGHSIIPALRLARVRREFDAGARSSPWEKHGSVRG